MHIVAQGACIGGSLQRDATLSPSRRRRGVAVFPAAFDCGFCWIAVDGDFTLAARGDYEGPAIAWRGR